MHGELYVKQPYWHWLLIKGSATSKGEAPIVHFVENVAASWHLWVLTVMLAATIELPYRG